ncbi:hypothetical protein EAH68_12705 [Corynebacterium hylobatis]|uniref:Uncharacterized protein n=1 Tax=Corynebacterium hylobatis TaxID=1859290 RepID=A0A3R9ZHL8_9CORY|nr:hypothetical protein [Corynebacterium hylobatis]RSZ61519.1 hypothetical protein EAH68_12705 [Corynebacterium hylobatis]
MLRVTRNIDGVSVTGTAPEKIRDAVEDCVGKVHRAFLDDGVEGIGLEDRMDTVAAMIEWAFIGFNNRVIADFEARVDQELAVADVFKVSTSPRGGA